MKKHIFYLLPLLAFAACTSNDDVKEANSNEIQLTSGVGVSAETRAVMTPTIPDAGFDINIALQEAALGGTMGNYTALTAADVKFAHVDKTGVVVFNDGAASSPVAKPEYYRADGGDTRLIGWYPKTATLGSGDGIITWNFTGEEDLMLTAAVTGSKTAKFDAAKKLTFGHLLTQIKVQVYAADAASLAQWGNITSISIKEQQKTCAVTLPSTVAFSGTPAALDLIKKKVADDAAITYPLAYATDNGTTKTECGYAMIQPVTTAATGIKLSIVTANGGTVEKTLAQKFDVGTAYTVTLKFTSSAIEPQVAISAWQTGTVTGGDIEM